MSEHIYWQYDDVPSSEKSIKSAKITDKFPVDLSVECCGILVVQQRTHPLHQVEYLLPYRPILVIDCDASRDHFALSASVPYVRSVMRDFQTVFRQMHTILISGADVQPDMTLTINDRQIKIHKTSYTVNYIASLTQWINIQQKNEFQRLGTVFDRNSPQYADVFKVYSNQLPFTQQILLQIVPLGVVPCDHDISTTERCYSSNFIDYRYCGPRSCTQRRFDGGKFSGDGHDGHAFHCEEYDTTPLQLFSYIFNDVDYKLDAGLEHRGEYNKHFRTLVSQVAEYDTKIAKAGLFALNPFAAFVALQSSSLLSKKVDNELPHEFGHTYGLPDWSGENVLSQKVKSFQLNRDYTLTYPYTCIATGERVYKTDSMNSAVGDATDRYFTSLSDYDNVCIEKWMAMAPSIDPAIQIDTDAAGAGISSSTTVLIVARGSDVHLFRINAYIPSRIDEANVAITRSVDYISVETYSPNGSMLYALCYNVDGQADEQQHDIVALPPHAIDVDGHIVVERPFINLKLKYFIRDDAKALPKAVITPTAEDQLPIDVYEWPVNDTTLEEPVALTRKLEKYYQIVMHLMSKSHAWHTITLPLMSSACVVGKSIFIYNKQSHFVSVNSRTVAPAHGIVATVDNRWIPISEIPGKSNWKYLSKNELEKQLPADSGLLNKYYSDGYEAVVIQTQDGCWNSPIEIGCLDPIYVRKLIIFDIRSTWNVTVNILGNESLLLKSGDLKCFQYRPLWVFKSFRFSSD